ncbi:hypothetical protein H7R52_00210 [Weissella confusa]|uniref:Uncharacterized protein n=1 Tax=Weissella confusa TaxID=1583 RepID=A0A923NCN7_WEICO|nr:hypothetical protein [Weissella confusa]
MTLEDVKTAYNAQDVPMDKLSAVIDQAVVKTAPKRKRLNWWQTSLNVATKLAMNHLNLCQR